MSTTVLVIDSNSAVQAITTLALNQTDCRVETLSDATQAYQKIKSLKPNVVLCAKEIHGVDPYALCQKVKAESKQTVFILLAPSEGVKQTAREAKEALYDEVIYKPFKSNRLREVVFGLLEDSKEEESLEGSFFLDIDDSLRKKILERFLARSNATLLPSLPTESTASVVLITDKPSSPAPHFKGKLFGLGLNLPNGKKIELPLSEANLMEVLSGLINPLPPQPLEQAPKESPQELDQTQLAADVSARIFRRLLTSESFKEGNWEKTAQILAEELQAAGSTKRES